MTTTTVGSVSVSDAGLIGDLLTQPGDVQYGGLLLPYSVGNQLAGWRDTADTSVGDTDRPQAHGSYPGDIWAGSQTVTETYRLPNLPFVTEADRIAVLRTIEANLPLDSVARPLAVHDGEVTFRMARVLQRHVPQEWDFRYSKKLECTVQWLCADPRRYSLDQVQAVVTAPMASGGLSYPLTYPLDYGSSQGSTRQVTNNGSTGSLPVVTFTGPLTNPALVSTSGWRLSFGITLAAGETLVVDTFRDTALLNGQTDRLYTIDNASSPLGRCAIPPGISGLTLVTAAGTGQASVGYRHAYL